MIPLHRLPTRARKYILALIVLSSSSAATTACCAPIVCDPAPPPATTPRPTFTSTPMICDPAPPPAMTMTATATHTPVICDPAPPPATSAAGFTRTPMICDPPPQPPLDQPQSEATAVRTALPLSEIRSVELVWDQGTSFVARSDWPEAVYRWSVSGGKLTVSGVRAVWRRPTEPGRYLLQVVADWGQTGLAVDYLILVLRPDGSLAIE